MAAILWTAGVFDVWVEPPATRVFPNVRAGMNSPREVRLYAACGEREAVQLCLRDDRKPRGTVAIEFEWLGTGRGFARRRSAEAGKGKGPLPGPEIYRVGYLDTSVSGQPELWPDPLLEYRPVDLVSGETVAFWLRFSAPRDATPGVYKGIVTIRPEKGPRKQVPVSLVVFHFVLPEPPTLRSLFRLDRDSIAAIYGISDTDPAAWKPVYDAFAAQHVSFNVLDDEVAAEVDTAYAHLEYAVRAARMNTIAIGSVTDDSNFAPMHDRLASQGWLDRAVTEPCVLPARSEWITLRRQLFRAKEREPRLIRLITGSLHPFFEGYAEIFAVPTDRFDPHADSRVRSGFSLIDARNFTVASAQASSSAPDTATTFAAVPEDACDGSAFTAWISRDVPQPGRPEWLELRLRLPVTTQHIKLIWKNGLEPASFIVTVNTAAGYVPLNAQWDPYPPVAPYGQSWAETRLDRPITFDAIRLEFARSLYGGPVGVTEMLLTDPPANLPKPIEPVETWVRLEPGRFPNLGVKGHPVEARMPPWICFGQTAAGYLSQSLNTWPEGWKGPAQTQPLVWRDADCGRNCLFYPGRVRPLPSVRAELLREGMEDYEYLAALESVAVKKQVKDAAILRWVRRTPYPPNPVPEALDRFMNELGQIRLKIGWTLDAIAEREGK